MDLTNDISVVLPELMLAIGATLLLMLGVFYKASSLRNMTLFSVALLAVVGVAVVMNPHIQATAFSGLFLVDRFGEFMKILVIFGAAVTSVERIESRLNAAMT